MYAVLRSVAVFVVLVIVLGVMTLLYIAQRRKDGSRDWMD